MTGQKTIKQDISAYAYAAPPLATTIGRCMVIAHRVPLLLIVLLATIFVNAGCSQPRMSIPKDRCDEAIAAYVEKTRNWAKGTYTIQFADINRLRNAATFGVIHNSVREDLERMRKENPNRMCYLHPDELTLLVDIVDYVVLSENTMDTYFPHAQPGYEYVIRPGDRASQLNKSEP